MGGAPWGGTPGVPQARPGASFTHRMRAPPQLLVGSCSASSLHCLQGRSTEVGVKIEKNPEVGVRSKSTSESDRNRSQLFGEKRSRSAGRPIQESKVEVGVETESTWLDLACFNYFPSLPSAPLHLTSHFTGSFDPLLPPSSANGRFGVRHRSPAGEGPPRG